MPEWLKQDAGSAGGGYENNEFGGYDFRSVSIFISSSQYDDEQSANSCFFLQSNNDNFKTGDGNQPQEIAGGEEW